MPGTGIWMPQKTCGYPKSGRPLKRHNEAGYPKSGRPLKRHNEAGYPRSWTLQALPEDIRMMPELAR